EHVEALFGKGHQLTKHSDLSQPGQYACKEQLNIVGPKGKVERVRILGPARKYTQVEISMTEQFKLGIHPPIRESGDIADTPGCRTGKSERQRPNRPGSDLRIAPYSYEPGRLSSLRSPR